MKPNLSSITLQPLPAGETLSVAVCIGTYNQAQYLRACIESALAQTYPIQEIWVSDDASTDNTPEVLEEICKLHPEVRYYRQPINLGLPAHLSWLLSQPSTDLIVRLDSDDFMEPDYVAVLTRLMDEYPEAGYAHCDVNEVDIKGKVRRVRRLARANPYEPPEETLKRSASGYRAAANCILYRAAAIRDAGYYRQTLTWRYCEDWHMIIRLAMNGWGNAYAPQVLTNYRVWDDPGGVRASRIMAHVQEIREIYDTLLIPEFRRRGWSLAPLRRNMHRRAAGFAGALDSPLFSEKERELFKSHLRELGGCFWLSIRIYLAERGFNPLFRFITRAEIRAKDMLKSCLYRVKR
jgi:glycosyltransferase involved in cell wall biosynthesis